MKKYVVLSYVLFILLFLLIAVIFIFLSMRIDLYTPSLILNAPQAMPTIIIDAGHGGEDGGAIGKNGVYEKELNLEISMLLSSMLTERGYDVVLTRSEDILLYDKNSDYKGRKKELDLAARVEIASKYKNCIFISIHMNAFSDSKYSGLQVYYSSNNANSKILADTVQNLVKEALQPSNNRKTKQGDGLFVLDRIESPAVLIECGFLSNYEECEKLCNEEYRKKLAFIISTAIEKYIENTLEMK